MKIPHQYVAFFMIKRFFEAIRTLPAMGVSRANEARMFMTMKQVRLIDYRSAATGYTQTVIPG